MLLSAVRGNFSDPGYLSINVGNAGVGVGEAEGVYFDDGLYHHLLVSVTGDQVDFYYDGQLKTTFTAGERDITHDIDLGGAPLDSDDGSRHFHGDIDEVQIHERGMTAQEVLDVYQQLPYQQLPNPTAIYIRSQEGNDTITTAADVLTTLVVFGGAGKDVVLGGQGDDRLYGGEDHDTLEGGSGRDQLFGEMGNDLLRGGAGDDSLLGGAGLNVLFGDDGDDYLFAGPDGNTLYGGDGNDLLIGDDGHDTLFGELGDDALYGFGGDDTLNGGEGRDELTGGDGADVLIGGDGDDDFNSDEDDPNQAPEVEQASDLSDRTGKFGSRLTHTHIFVDDPDWPSYGGDLSVSVAGPSEVRGEDYTLYLGSECNDPIPSYFFWHPRHTLAHGDYTVTITATDLHPTNPLSTDMTFTASIGGYNDHTPVLRAYGSPYHGGVAYFYLGDEDSDGIADDVPVQEIPFFSDDARVDRETPDEDLEFGGDLTSDGKLIFDPNDYAGQNHTFVLRVSDDGQDGQTVRTQDYSYHISVVTDLTNSDGETIRFDPGLASDRVTHTDVDTSIDIDLSELNSLAWYSETNGSHYNFGQPIHGRLSEVSNHILTYTPDPGFEGLETFTWSFFYDHPDPDRQDATTNVATIWIEVGSLVQVNLSVEGLSEADEAQGSVAVVALNDDYDNGSSIPDIDLYDPIPEEDDLLEVKVDLKSTRDNLNGDDVIGWFRTGGVPTNIRLWKDPQKKERIFQSSFFSPHVDYFTLTELQQLGSIYVEGRLVGYTELTLSLDSTGRLAGERLPSGGHISISDAGLNDGSDTVNIFVASIDLDIDSDNNNGFAHPEGSDWEEELEDHEYALGKLIMLDNPTRPVTPLVLHLPRNLDSEDPNVQVRFDWNPSPAGAGQVRLWKTPVIDEDRNPAAVDAGGDRIYPDFNYSLDDLGYHAGSGEIVIYAEGVEENEILKTLAGVEEHGRPNEFIEAIFVVNGVDTLSDKVKYVVANEDSFLYHLQTRQEVRAELAARGVYARADMPEFSLEPQYGKDLIELGVPKEIIPYLVFGGGVPGFKAMLYQDYITGGDNQFSLAFAGTDDVDDILEDIWQGLGRFTPQYAAAIEIGDQILEAQNIKGLITVGHSLGGGLASAASLSGGIAAMTFNAAGLHANTIAMIPNPINAPITAYYVDWDLLTYVQTKVAFLPTAYGTSDELEGPYDSEVIAGIILQKLGAGAISWIGLGIRGGSMVLAHLNTAVLYGLLSEEALGYDVFGYHLGID